MNKIKILELIDGGFLGGGQANVLSIIRNIDNSRFNLHVAAEGGGPFETEVLNTGVKFTSVIMPKLLRTKYLKLLELLYNTEKFDIIHTHGGVAGFYGRILKKHYPALKCVHSIHGIHYLNSRNFFRSRSSKTIEQYLVQFTDKTICETYTDYITAVKNKIADPLKTAVIANGIQISKYANRKKDTGLISELGFTNDNFIIGNISRFDEQKNQKLIIQAAYFLVKKYPQTRFVFVGSGKYLQRMKNLVSESSLEKYTHFAGEQKNIGAYYSIFDIFVFPTFWEGMPYVLLEAMVSGLPVICSSIPSLLEVVKPNHSALTINPNDMDDLFQKISVLIQNPELRQNIAQNALIESTQYDEAELIPEVEKIYTEVMG